MGVVGVSLTFLGFFSSYWVALYSLDMRAFALSYCTLICCFRLLSPGGLLLSKGKWRGNGSKEEGRWGESGEE